MEKCMPDLALLSDELNELPYGTEFSQLIMDANDEEFLSEMYGPSAQNIAPTQAIPSTEPAVGMKAEAIENFLMESPYLKKLSENQATLMENYTKLVQNQEKLLEGQENTESTLKEILNEIRFRKGYYEEKAEHDRSFKRKNIHKRKRYSDANNEIETSPITRSKKPKVDIPLNIDRTLYFNNSLSKICVICKKRYERIVYHYKTCHSLSEVFPSRLSPKMAKEVQKNNADSNVVIKGYNNLIEANCFFCEGEKAFTANYWPLHIQSHTGEYKNICRVCNINIPCRSYHCRQKTQNIDEFRLDEDDLTAHLCLECNYVQIEKSKIVEHLKSQHKFNDEALEGKYKVITLLSIKRIGENPKVESAAIEEISDHPEEMQSLIELNQCVSEPDTPDVDVHLDDFAYESNIPVENTKYWRMQKAIKHDPAENEHLLAVAEHYKQSSTYAFQVKQWIDDKWTKPALSIISQFALFKCMHPQCIFSTNTKEDMERHMEHHLALMEVLKSSADGILNKTVRDEQIKFRDCCYCDFNANSNNELLDHVVTEHDQCIFQCAYCFYRSVEVDNLCLHYDAYHSKKKREIYICGEVREFREQDKEMLQEDVEKIQKIPCEQDYCSEKYGTFHDLIHHLNSDHLNNTNYKCPYCNVIVSHKQIESHFNVHNFWEFECIYCQYFGDNDILNLRKHLSSEHPSKFSFVVTRRRMPDVELISDYNILYIGDLHDHSLYKFIKLPSGTDLSCMDPSLHAHESHRSQLSVEIEKIPFTEPLPKITFCGTENDFSLKYSFPYLCMADIDATGVVCNFGSNKEDDLHRHISKKHSDKQIKYKTVEIMSQIEKVTKMVICEFECNICKKLYKTPKEVSDHFKKTHSINFIDSKMIQNIEIIESTDPNQLVKTKETILNRLQFSSLFLCIHDGKYANTKSQIIAHHRRVHPPSKWLEFQMQTTIYDSSFFGWSADALSQENQKFDRMMAYECFHCCNELTLNHLLFESVEELETHCKEMHETKNILYIPKKLVACVECSTVSTIDGMRHHYLQNHPNATFALASPTSKHNCGVCNLSLSARSNLIAKNNLIEHFKKEHPIGYIEKFDDRLLRKLQIKSDSKTQFSPECCKQNQFNSIQQLVVHIVDCSHVNTDVKSALKQGNVKEFLKPFFNTNIFFDNGLTVTIKSIKNSTIGLQMKNLLIKEIDSKNIRL